MGLVRQAAAAARAEASLLLHGPLPADRVSLRLLLCRSCERLLPGTEEEVGHCGACGCPRSARAALARKATMPAARCPLGRWEAAEARSRPGC